MPREEEEIMADNRQIAKDVLNAVGGSGNVSHAAHCMTRLRLTLKDETVADDNVIKNIDGVLGVVHKGGQTQIVIGQNVPKVYQAFCEMGGISSGSAPAAAADKPKEKLTAKGVLNNILNYLSGSLTPLIPVIIAAAMFKTIMAIIGPDMMGICSVESDLYRLLDFVYDAGFYFLPIYLGYTAAKKLGTSEVLGMFLGGILLAPDFIDIVNAGEAFRVFGIPTSLNNYSQSVLPMILSVYALKHVHSFFKKYIPDTLSTIFVPLLTMLVMIPVSLCVLAPLGSIVGTYISTGLLAFGGVGGFIAVAVIAALWEFLVMSGMHMVLIVTMMTIIMTEGSEAMVSPAATCATMAAIGMALGAFVKLKDKKEKSLSMGYFISGILGGVTEPALYGLGFKYKKPFIGMMIGGALGGLYAGITHVASYAVGATNFLIVLGFAAGGTANFVNGTISCVISLLTAAIATYFIGFDEKSA